MKRGAGLDFVMQWHFGDFTKLENEVKKVFADSSKQRPVDQWCSLTFGGRVGGTSEGGKNSTSSGGPKYDYQSFLAVHFPFKNMLIICP